MLEVFVNFICAFMLALLGFLIIRNYSIYNTKITIKTIIIFIINSLLIVTIHYINYNAFSSLLNFIINTITYKIVFNDSIEESFIKTGLLTILLLVSDIISLIIQINFTTLNDIQNNVFIYLISNILVIVIAKILIFIKPIRTLFKKCYKILSSKDLKLNATFIILVIIGASAVLYNLFLNYKFNIRFISDIVIIVSLIIIGIIFTNNRDTYNKLSSQYDILLQNVQTFEEWIEREQFTRHEYKNQLAVLYAMSSEKEVKNKIEEIINQNLNIKNEVVNNLKDLPKGGLKGLLYYKTIIAEKNKLKVTVDISIKPKGILSKLSKEKINTISKIIGIYYDNAIEAAKESRKKTLLFEIYELKDKVNIVISNTFKKSSLIDNHFEKGISSKGSGHGNGLYYASRILKANNWLEQKQEIIDNYYVETISIRKNTSNK